MRTLGLVVLILAMPNVGQTAADIRLVDNGRSDYVVVLPASPSESESLAADELKTYIQLISGVELPLQKAGALPPKAVVISERAHLEGWPPVSDQPQVTGDAYAVVAAGSRLFLVGGRGRSTLYAVYDLLERLGCKWLAPKFEHYRGSAELVPNRETLAIEAAKPVIEKPALDLRKLYVEEGHSHNAQDLVLIGEWMAKARFNTLVIPTDYQGAGRVKWDNWRRQVAPELQKRDITIEVGGHGYQNFLNAEMEDGKLFQRHREWFGRDSEGVRRREHRWVFCTSNPEAVGYLSANFLKYVQERPEIQVFDFWPPDGARWCECENCTALGSPSNRQAILVEQVKAEVAGVRADLRLECLAYHTSITPPESAELDDQVLLDFCPISQCFEVQINDPASERNAEYVAGLRAWRKAFDGGISIYSYYRKYAWRSLPVIIPHYMQNDLQFYRTVPVQGVSSYAEPGDWFTYELNHYLLGRLAWDPCSDVDTLVREFCEARYGPAREAAENAFSALEDVVRRVCSIPGTSLKSVEELSQAGKRLAAASAGLKDVQSSVSDPAIQRDIGRLLLALEYARRDIEIQKSRAAKAPSAQTRKLVEDLAAFLPDHAQDGVFVIHGRTQLPNLLKPYGIKEESRWHSKDTS